MNLEDCSDGQRCCANHEDEGGVALLGEYDDDEYIEGEAEEIHDLRM